MRSSLPFTAACSQASTKMRAAEESQNVVAVMSATTTVAPEAKAKPTSPHRRRALVMSISQAG